MGWRTVVVSRSSKLDLRLGYMVVRDSEQTVRIHIDEISVLVVENTATSITTALMSELTKKKVKVIFCDEKRNPSSELAPYYGCHDCTIKLRKQLQWNKKTKEWVWTTIVSRKIRMQAENLDFFGLNESSLLYRYIDEIEFDDSTNREGHAAKVYFNAMFGKDFSRSDETPINAMLDYGYSIILSCINREVVANGYLTQLGIFHDNMFNQFNLSCDLMEPFRPIVDRKVKNYMPQKFESEEKRCILELLSSELVIDGRKNTMLNAIKIYTKSVLDALEENDVAHIKFYRYEL